MSNVEFDLEKVHQGTVAKIEKILLQGGLMMVRKAKENLIANKHHVTGRLSKSVTMNQEGLKLEFGANIDYAISIETGVTNENPTSDSIKTWLKRKIQLGHIPINEWAQSKTLAPFSEKAANRIRKKSIETVINNVSKKTALNIALSGKIKNFHPFLEPSFSGELKEIREKISQAVEQ